MARDAERMVRSGEGPIVGGLPDFPGILAAIGLTPGLAQHLRGLADELLVKDFPGATLTRAERELIATAVSAGNDCFYCMDSHGAFAAELLRRQDDGDVSGACGADAPKEPNAVVDAVKIGRVEGLGARMRALLDVAGTVRRNARALTRNDVETAIAAGATDADVQLAVLIASAFCMYNRMVDGFRAKTPPSAEAYRARATEIAQHGYADPKTTSVPR